MARRARLLELLGSLLIAVGLGGSLTMMIADAMGLHAPAHTVYGFCAAVALLLSLGAYSRMGLLASCGLSAGLLLIWGLAPAKPFQQLGALFAALADYLSGGQAMLTEHSLAIALCLGLLLTAAIHWMSRMSGGVYPALTLSLVVMMGSWLVDNRLTPQYVIPAVASLVMMFTRSSDEKLPYVRALPAAVLVALIAYLLLPAGNPTWEPLKDAADRVRQMFYNYFMFTETRVTYSLYPDGFQPMGEPLGGPADPSDHPVMLVQSDDMLLLRGAIKRTYTSYAWTNSAINNRYLFVDPTKRGARDQIFDSARLESDELGKAFKRVDGQVTMVSEGISTLFVPHRLQELEGTPDAAVYFNSSGEVFITRGVETGDHYSFSALLPTGDTKALDQLLSEKEQGRDPYYDAAAAEYTSLPKGIESEVYQLAQQVTKGGKTPYQKALLLQKHLMNSYTYSLDVPYPPQNRDFVSYFLLTEKKGYCSYFASAMAVMARMIGLPSRYIEGYMAPPGGEDGTLVTGHNAHAWVEIYFKGVGWVTFNPTPGDETSQEGGGQGGETPQQPDQPEETPPPEDDQQQEDDPPEEDPQDEQPEETPPPEEDLSDDPGEDDPGAGDENDGELTPDDQQDNASDAGSDDEDGAGDQQPNLWWLWLLLGLGTLGGGGYLLKRRLDASDPVRRSKAAGGDERLAIWYRALLGLLLEQGQAPNADETPDQFARRLKEAGVCGDEFAYVAQQMSLSRYAHKKPESAVYKQAQQAYQRQLKALKPLEKLSWYRQRIVRGLGDTTHIP